mgnify:CR=1 FL=1
MALWPTPITLQGSACSLEPLHPDHHDEQVAATLDGELWKLWYTFVPRAEDMRKEIDRRLALQAAFHVEQRAGFDVERLTSEVNQGVGWQEGGRRGHSRRPSGVAPGAVTIGRF